VDTFLPVGGGKGKGRLAVCFVYSWAGGGKGGCPK
jgi:hypothetical protein